MSCENTLYLFSLAEITAMTSKTGKNVHIKKLHLSPPSPHVLETLGYVFVELHCHHHRHHHYHLIAMKPIKNNKIIRHIK